MKNVPLASEPDSIGAFPIIKLPIPLDEELRYIAHIDHIIATFSDRAVTSRDALAAPHTSLRLEAIRS